MIQNDAEILQRMVENWQKKIPDYVDKLKDKILGRIVMPNRSVGADVAIDVVQHFQRNGAGAQILAKGVPPKGSSFDASSIPFEIFQMLDGFHINEKDLKLDSSINDRLMDIVMKNITRLENSTIIAGNASKGILGIAGMANANPLGTFTATAGPWNGSGAARDIYNDLLNAMDLMDTKFEPRFLIGNKRDLDKLFALDTVQKQPFWKQAAWLFGKTDRDDPRSWMVPVDTTVLPQGFAYMSTYDEEAAEFVISENPQVRRIAQQPGGNYPIEVYEWVAVEGHNNGGFVKIKTN